MHALLLLTAQVTIGYAMAVPTRNDPTPTVVKRDSSATVDPPAAVASINDNDGVGSGTNSFTSYTGDGSASAGWPSIDQWVSFEDMFNNNKPNFFSACDAYNVADDSDDEVGSIWNAIEQVAGDSGVDHRFILAIILNESSGCVRVPTTLAPDLDIYNPGLMQDFDGYYTCNTSEHDEYDENLGVVSPCPQATISGMIREGAQGTDQGDGLATLINEAQEAGASDAQTFYVAAEWYNQGAYSPAVGGDLGTYAQNAANYLVGWLSD